MEEVNNIMSDEKLLRYISGDVSIAEKQEVELWYVLSQENAALLELLYETHMLKDCIETLEQTDSELAFMDFKRRVAKKQGGIFGISRARLIRYSQRVAVAAVFTLVVIFSSIWCTKFIERIERPTIVRTNIGERVQIELPDGSNVWLNACSEIKYGTSIFNSQREVAISGEAYFEVEKDPKTPFIVNCKGMNIKVLGTKFNVRANNDENILATTLLEGAVYVNSPLLKNKKGITMKPDQQLYINKKNGMAELVMTENAGTDMNWISGRFSFQGATFEEIARSLQRNYNIEITFKDEIIRHKMFTCDFEASDNIYRILSIMEMTGKFKYTIKGREVEISSR